MISKLIHKKEKRKLKVLVTQSCLSSLWPHGVQPTRLLCLWDSPGKNTGVGCHALPQGFCLTQGANTCLLHLPTLASRFFTIRTTWEAQNSIVEIAHNLGSSWPSAFRGESESVSQSCPTLCNPMACSPLEWAGWCKVNDFWNPLQMPLIT